MQRLPTSPAFAEIARALLDDVLPLPLPIRLMGLTLSKLAWRWGGGR